VTLFARVTICRLLVHACDYRDFLTATRRDAPPLKAASDYGRQAGSKISRREFSSDFRRARMPSGSVNMGLGV